MFLLFGTNNQKKMNKMISFNRYDKYCHKCKKWSKLIGSCYDYYKFMNTYMPCNTVFIKKKKLDNLLSQSEFMKENCPYYLEIMIDEQNM